MGYRTMTVQELHERISSGVDILLVDVREPFEHEIASIPGARVLPLSRFDEWENNLNPDEEMVFMCHHGVRSAQVCSYLERRGFSYIFNLEGGIDSWSQEIDRGVPRY